MLQLRGENEQFSSLPSLRTLDHPRHSIITTDRPDSSQLVDLHVYVVPKNVWKDVQRLAQNEAMEDAISAGFVRVSPNTTIRELRKPIEQLCGKESYFPQNFIYLRSVGRCLTKVKSKQEGELRVKNYRPPQTFAPEIYLLEGRQEDHQQTSSVSPAPSSPCDVCGTHDGHRADHEKHRSHRHDQRANHKENHEDHDENHSDYERNRFTLNDHGRSPSRLSQNYHRKPMRGGKQYQPTTNSNDLYSHNPPSERQSWAKFTQIGSDQEESITNLSDAPSGVSSNLPKLKQEQERLRRRQAELERMRRAAEEKRARSERSEGERSRSEEDAAQKIQSSFRGFKDRQDFQERKRNTNRLDRSKKVDDEKKVSMPNQSAYQGFRRQPLLNPASVKTQHENPKPSNPKRSKLAGNNNEYENTRNEISSSTKESKEPIRFNPPSSSSSSIDNQRTKRSVLPPIPLKTQESIDTSIVTIDSSTDSSRTDYNDVQIMPIESVNEPQQLLDKSLPRTTSEIKSKETIINEEIDLERRNAESKRRRQLEDDEEKKKGKHAEDQRRKDLSKGTREDPEALRVRHQEIRGRRADLEKVREEVIKHLKNIHNRITLRRKEARDMWKKKYFNEKKKHPPLEERIATLKTDLEQIHKKTVQTMEAEAKYAAQMGYTREAENGSSIANVTRINHEIQEIRHQVEQAKLRLTTDVKLRNQAENEGRSLKHELNQARMNLNEIKTRAGP